MWAYAQLSKVAKQFGGPVGLVAAIAAGGMAVGSAGTLLVQKLRKEMKPGIPKQTAGKKDDVELGGDAEESDD